MYKIKATDSDGESNEVSVTVGQSDILTVIATPTNASPGLSDGSISTTVSGGTPPYEYSWSNGATSPSIFNIPGGRYTLLVRDANGCEFMIQDIRVGGGNDPVAGCYEGSSILTPNGDGANDFFIIECASDFPARLEIFNRVGARVFGTDNYSNGWNGVANDGDPLPEGSYMWVLEVNFGQGNRELYTGTVTLLRDF